MKTIFATLQNLLITEEAIAGRSKLSKAFIYSLVLTSVTMAAGFICKLMLFK